MRMRLRALHDAPAYNAPLVVLHFDILLVVELVSIGLLAGVLGGLLGVGGSTVIIPGLTMVFGYHQHLYQAVAMIANVTVSIPAALRHRKAGAMTPAILRRILAMAVVFVIVGVWLSNAPLFRGSQGGVWLGRVLAVFLVYVAIVNIQKLIKPRKDTQADPDSAPTTVVYSPHADTDRAASSDPRWGSAFVGSVMGLIAGLLGIGGGAIAVPLQQVVLKLPLKSCIANSSAVICVSATLGAIYKNASLFQHGYSWYHSLALAMILAPSCWLGGHLGANLTHRLPVRQVRVAFICLVLAAAIKMAAIF